MRYDDAGGALRQVPDTERRERGKPMKKTLQLVFQAVFLALFVCLTLSGRAQVWMGVFALSILAAFLLGRVYCGWICPIHTVMRGIAWIKKKLRIPSARIPSWMTKPWVRMFALGLFLAAFAFTMATGKKLPVLPALFALGVLLTLVFPEALWHRHLCPYGTILSLPARKSGRAMVIESALCNGCGMCHRVCPAEAVEKRERHYEILKSECLVCMACSEACRQGAIGYQSTGLRNAGRSLEPREQNRPTGG